MKKTLKLLIILIIIFLIGFLIYKFIPKKTKENSQNFSEVKKYISDIYGKTFLIPEFDNMYIIYSAIYGKYNIK